MQPLHDVISLKNPYHTFNPRKPTTACARCGNACLMISRSLGTGRRLSSAFNMGVASSSTRAGTAEDSCHVVPNREAELAQAAKCAEGKSAAAAVIEAKGPLPGTEGDTQQSPASHAGDKTQQSPPSHDADHTQQSPSGMSRPQQDTEAAHGSSSSGQHPHGFQEFSRLQSRVMELINSGYIESVKQLRETLMVLEWDMHHKQLAKRRAVASFERYVAEHDLVKEVGGYSILSALYENPDALNELLHNDKMRMLARSMIEESLNDRRSELYQSCNATAKEMASLTNSKLPGGVLGQGLVGGAMQLWNAVRSRLPFK